MQTSDPSMRISRKLADASPKDLDHENEARAGRRTASREKTGDKNAAGCDDTALIGSDEIVSIADSVDGILVRVPGTDAEPSTGTVSDAPVRFKIRLANTEGQRSSVSYLIEKMYSWRGYVASGPRPTPNRVTLMASDAQRTLATITVGFDSEQGLVVEELYKPEIEQLRSAGSRLCEFTKLAVDRDAQSMDVLALMFHVAYMYARRLHDRTDLAIEVNPRHVRFYERMLGFERLTEPRLCPRVGAPAVLMRLELAHAQAQIESYGGQRQLAGTIRSLYPLFFSADEEKGIVGRLRAIG